MSNLKISLSIGSFNIELDGSSEEVVTQFNDLKKNGLGEIVNQLINFAPANLINTTNFHGLSLKSKDELPNEIVTAESDFSVDTSLKEVIYRGLASSESEWILVYAYFLEQDQGKTEFERKDLIKMYENSNRKTLTRIKNLTSSLKICIKNLWIRAINDQVLVMSEKGRSYVRDILSRQEAISRPSKNRKKIIPPETVENG